MSRGWFCPRHGYIGAENEVSRIRNHRFVVGCSAILELREDFQIIFKDASEASA